MEKSARVMYLSNQIYVRIKNHFHEIEKISMTTLNCTLMEIFTRCVM